MRNIMREEIIDLNVADGGLRIVLAKERTVVAQLFNFLIKLQYDIMLNKFQLFAKVVSKMSQVREKHRQLLTK